MALNFEQIVFLIDGHIFRPPNGSASEHALAVEFIAADKTFSDAMPLRDAGIGDVTLVDSMLKAPEFAIASSLVAIAPRKIAEELSGSTGKTVIGVENLHLAFATLLQAIRGRGESTIGWFSDLKAERIHSTSVIHPTVTLAEDVLVGPKVVIGAYCNVGRNAKIHTSVQIMDGCSIGEGCELFPGVVLYPGTVLHDRVIIHSNSVLGAYGFGYKQKDGVHVRTSQLGWVEVEDDVEIGACTTIDRGTYGPTQIGTGSKLDNHIQIGHNVKIGNHNLLCAQVGIAGSTTIGDYVVLGGQVGVRDHLTIGDRCLAAAQAGIANDLPSDTAVLGSPALPQREATQIFLHSQKLPEIRKTLKTFESRLANVETQISATTEKPAASGGCCKLKLRTAPSDATNDSAMKKRAA